MDHLPPASNDSYCIHDSDSRGSGIRLSLTPNKIVGDPAISTYVQYPQQQQLLRGSMSSPWPQQQPSRRIQSDLWAAPPTNNLLQQRHLQCPIMRPSSAFLSTTSSTDLSSDMSDCCLADPSARCHGVKNETHQQQQQQDCRYNQQHHRRTSSPKPTSRLATTSTSERSQQQLQQQQQPSHSQSALINLCDLQHLTSIECSISQMQQRRPSPPLSLPSLLSTSSPVCSSPSRFYTTSSPIIPSTTLRPPSSFSPLPSPPQPPESTPNSQSATLFESLDQRQHFPPMPPPPLFPSLTTVGGPPAGNGSGDGHSPILCIDASSPLPTVASLSTIDQSGGGILSISASPIPTASISCLPLPTPPSAASSPASLTSLIPSPEKSPPSPHHHHRHHHHHRYHLCSHIQPSSSTPLPFVTTATTTCSSSSSSSCAAAAAAAASFSSATIGFLPQKTIHYAIPSSQPTEVTHLPPHTHLVRYGHNIIACPVRPPQLHYLSGKYRILSVRC